jgi:hypothetical protein
MLPPRCFRDGGNPKFEEYRPRTAYSLFNCCTDVLGRTRQQSFPAESALATMRLSKLLTPPKEQTLDVAWRPVADELATSA